MSSTQAPSVSIIILNFNGKRYLEACLRSLEALDYPKDKLEVIMGDNASTDDSVGYVEQVFPLVKVVRFQENFGFCKPNNACAKLAAGEYLVFLNNDTFVNRDWLSEMANRVMRDDGVISCACRMLFAGLGDKRLINSAGGVLLPTGCGLYEGWLCEDSEIYGAERYTGFGCGAGVLIKKSFFLDTGGFDEYYFYSGEEMDFGMRVWMRGHKVAYAPSAVMYHYMGATGFKRKARAPAIEFLVVRNKIYFILKNYEFPDVVKGLFFQSLASFYEIAYCLLRKNTAIPLSVIKAYAAILKDAGKIMQNRKASQSQRKVSDRQLRAMGVIVSVREWIRRVSITKRNTEKYFGSVYDKEDAVKIRLTKDGEPVFYKVG